ncbi:2'-5' RNA ligase family protein [Patescibacteria group bacterium]|nr:2'-5' RNA ligase family protein [Patescibacteria group bacterium]
MPQLAIDIVLLPPEEVMDKAIAINNQLSGDAIRLNKLDCLPHISLCMGVVREEDLEKVKQIINQIGQNYKPLPLTINKIDGKHVCFEIVNTKELQSLHEAIMTKLEPYLSYNSTVDCFLGEEINERTLCWVNNYKEKSSFSNFYPHITLGKYEIEGKDESIYFTASKLAVCHLGNYCTCRKILHSVDLF